MERQRLITVLLIAVVLLVPMVQLFLKTSSRNVSALETTIPIGLYWDANLTRPVDRIDWGTLALGEEKKVEIYVKNEGNEPFILTLTPVNWQGDNTSNCMTFSCERPNIRPGETVQIAPSLLISSNASGLSSFSFDIAFSEASITIADFDTFFSNNPNVRMIYPSDNSDKPLNCNAAMVSDWTASAFVSTKLTNFTEGLDTKTSFVNQTNGKPVGASGTGIISFGGPMVNLVVIYAESNNTTLPDKAPIKFHNDNGLLSFQYSNGSAVSGTSMQGGIVSTNQDMFVIETFQDGGGRYIMLCYGFGWKGTYAAGKYFYTIIYPNLGSYNEAWIVVKWDDTNNNGFVNAPGDGDTYTMIAKGN